MTGRTGSLTPSSHRPQSKRLSIGADGFAVVRIVLLVVASTFVATVGDVFVEASIGLGAFGPGYVDRSHQTIVPAGVVAIALFLLVAAWLRAERRYDERWLLLAARDAEGLGVARAVATVTGCALALSGVMERAEQLLGGGAPYGGLPLLGWAGLAVALVFTVAATVAVLAVGASVRAVVAAFDVVARAMRTCVVLFVGPPHLFDAGERPRYPDTSCFVAMPVRAKSGRGERAPPRVPHAIL